MTDSGEGFDTPQKSRYKKLLSYKWSNKAKVKNKESTK